jgi:alpha-ketoglutarate-dependent 2,4-dichlorophenoxyacetate dioxygenase
VPEHVAQAEQPLAVVPRQGLQVAVEVGDVVDFHRQAAGLALDDVAGGQFQRAEVTAEGDLLGVVDALVRDMVCDHSQIYSRGVLGFTDFTPEELAKWTPVPQRLVRRHPGSGRLSLFLSAHAGAIHGMPVPEARALLRDLNEHATQREFVHAHVWQPHDLVMWDNRATMHRARRYAADVPRDLHRTTVADVAPTLEQAA